MRSPRFDDRRPAPLRDLCVAACATLFLLAPRAAGTDGSFYLRPADRVVYYGTDPDLQHAPSIYVDAFVATRFPEWQVEFTHAGWGTTHPGSSPEDRTRLEGEISGWKPTVLVLGPAARMAIDLPGVRTATLQAGGPAAAAALLRSWSAPAEVTRVEIDAAGKRVVDARNTTVRELESDRVVAWSQDDRTLPLPPEMIRQEGGQFTALNLQTLRVSGLVSGQYQLTIDCWLMGTFDRDQFEQGIDLTRLPTPMARQAAEVYALTWKQVAAQYALRSQAKSKNGEAMMRQLVNLEADLREQRRLAGRPGTHDYEITPAP